jgi:hypothetical protein
MLDCDGGRENAKLWKWYEDQGFTGLKDAAECTPYTRKSKASRLSERAAASSR